MRGPPPRTRPLDGGGGPLPRRRGSPDGGGRRRFGRGSGKKRMSGGPPSPTRSLVGCGTPPPRGQAGRAVGDVTGRRPHGGAGGSAGRRPRTRPQGGRHGMTPPRTRPRGQPWGVLLWTRPPLGEGGVEAEASGRPQGGSGKRQRDYSCRRLWGFSCGRGSRSRSRSRAARCELGRWTAAGECRPRRRLRADGRRGCRY